MVMRCVACAWQMPEVARSQAQYDAAFAQLSKEDRTKHLPKVNALCKSINDAKPVATAPPPFEKHGHKFEIVQARAQQQRRVPPFASVHHAPSPVAGSIAEG